jgi:hypothetical protein
MLNVLLSNLKSFRQSYEFIYLSQLPESIPADVNMIKSGPFCINIGKFNLLQFKERLIFLTANT